MSGDDHRRVWGYIGSGILIWLGIVALALLISNVGFGDDHKSEVVVGGRLPDFELANINGERVRLSQRLGKPLIINFWATWCAPCVIEMPNIQKYYNRYEGEFDVLAVNADEPAGPVRSFVDDMGLTFDILLDPGGEIQLLYQIRGYPTSLFVDTDGIIRAQHIGLLTEDQLEGYLAQVGVGP